MGGCGLDSFGTGQETVRGSCKPVGSKNPWDILKLCSRPTNAHRYSMLITYYLLHVGNK